MDWIVRLGRLVIRHHRHAFVEQHTWSYVRQDDAETILRFYPTGVERCLLCGVKRRIA